MLQPNARTIKILEELGWAEKWRKKAFKEGIEKGIEKGRQQNIEKTRLEAKLEANLENARAMFREGISVDKIARITKIPLRRLKKELQAQ